MATIPVATSRIPLKSLCSPVVRAHPVRVPCDQRRTGPAGCQTKFQLWAPQRKKKPDRASVRLARSGSGSRWVSCQHARDLGGVIRPHASLCEDGARFPSTGPRSRFGWAIRPIRSARRRSSRVGATGSRARLREPAPKRWLMYRARTMRLRESVTPFHPPKTILFRRPRRPAIPLPITSPVAVGTAVDGVSDAFILRALRTCWQPELDASSEKPRRPAGAAGARALQARR